MTDNWKNRSSEMRCATCMWYVIKKSSNSDNELGRCRKKAPTLNGWPAVFNSDWCGDHKLDENKIFNVALKHAD